MVALAWKNLFHDRVRLVVTLVGIVFALVLILVQFGLFLGFMETSSNIVGYSRADIWIAAPKIPHVNAASVLDESKRFVALSVPGVATVDRYALAFNPWKLPSGAQELVQVVGYNLSTGLGGPWNITQGSVDELRAEDTVMIDELYADKLGVKKLGDTAEIANKRVKVVGFTRGIRSFTTAPYAFTSFKNAQNYTHIEEDQTFYFLVKAAPGVAVAELKKALQERMRGVDIYTTEEMRRKTQNYWVFETGAGITTLIGSVLGLIVGIVVVAQTIYSATVDHIREFGTLKAMGASNKDIYAVILTQAAISAAMGYAIAVVIAKFVAQGSESGSAPILLPDSVAAGTFLLALAMCASASILSIRKATQIDPAMVFRG
ncbi:MAG: FtsX-like permease family protein [Bryobacteraceae bacterium]